MIEADKERRGRRLIVYGSKKVYDFLEQDLSIEYDFSSFNSGKMIFFSFAPIPVCQFAWKHAVADKKSNHIVSPTI